MHATITLSPREPPLTAVGVAATGAALAPLAAATRRRLAGGADLRAAAGQDWLVVLGEADDLPWADGCVYLGRDGTLLMATTRRPSLGADLVARALRLDGGGDLLVLLDDTVLRGPLPARLADPARLEALG